MYTLETQNINGSWRRHARPFASATSANNYAAALPIAAWRVIPPATHGPTVFALGAL